MRMEPDYSPNFEMPVDRHGRVPDALAPEGGTVIIAVSAVANGSYLPGDRDDILTRPTIIRIAASKDVRIRFSHGISSADATDMLFQAGTETERLPRNTNHVSAITDNPAESGTLCITIMK